MERRQDRSAPRVFEDHRDNLTVDVQNVLVQERASQLRSEDSQIALLWNVFRSLQNLDARLWLPRLVLQALGAKRNHPRLRGLLTPAQILEPTFLWWHRFELPPSRHEWLRDQACNATLDLTHYPACYLAEKKAEEDDNVKALIVRINSPGGTITSSDLIYREIDTFKSRRKVPVVAVMMDVAASGGYYAALAADTIVALPTTVTGSIGVIMLTVNAQGLMEKIGVAPLAIKSGEMKDAGSPFRPLTTEERAVFQSVIDQMYGRFVTLISRSRRIPEDRVRTSPTGGSTRPSGQSARPRGRIGHGRRREGRAQGRGRRGSARHHVPPPQGLPHQLLLGRARLGAGPGKLAPAADGAGQRLGPPLPLPVVALSR
jgi:signal peptide peptidase SppA